MYQVAFFGYNFDMKKSKWTAEQINLLLQKTAQGVRMHAFEEIALATGRRANSIRNYYYKYHAKQKKQIVPLDVIEVKNLLREIILGTSRGESVRGICLKLAGNDRAKMLRLQNKYRAVITKNPDSIQKMTKTLEAQGYFVKSPVSNIIQMPQQKTITDTDINNLFAGLVRLIKSNANEEIEKLKTEIERLKSNAQTSYTLK